jgi:hypothetical protein
MAIGDKYQISIDGQLTHTASTELFRLFAMVNVFSMTGNENKVTIGKKFSWFKAKYYIQRHDDGVLMF